MNKHTLFPAPIRIAGADLGRNMTMDKYFFYHFLAKHFPLEVVPPEEADFLLYCSFGFKHEKFKGVKIFFTGENKSPNFHECDYALTHEPIESVRHFRLPYYAQIHLTNNLDFNALNTRPPITIEQWRAEKTKFCNFIYRNHVCKARNKLFHALSAYKRVESGGQLFNNIGGRVENKLELQSTCKFSIAYENEEHLGYTTEKIFDALLSRSIPIYWGNPNIAQDFNSAAFIHARDFATQRELIDYIRQVDADDELALRYINAPILPPHRQGYITQQDIINFFTAIFRNPQPLRTKWDRILYWRSQTLGYGSGRQINRLIRYLLNKSPN